MSGGRSLARRREEDTVPIKSLRRDITADASSSSPPAAAIRGSSSSVGGKTRPKTRPKSASPTHKGRSPRRPWGSSVQSPAKTPDDKERGKFFSLRKFAMLERARKDAHAARAEATNARAEANNAKAVAQLCASALSTGRKDEASKLEMNALVEAAMLSEEAASRAEERRAREVSALAAEVAARGAERDALAAEVAMLGAERDALAESCALFADERAAAAAAFAAVASQRDDFDAERFRCLSQAADAVEAAATIAKRIAVAEARATKAEETLKQHQQQHSSSSSSSSSKAVSYQAAPDAGGLRSLVSKFNILRSMSSVLTYESDEAKTTVDESDHPSRSRRSGELDVDGDGLASPSRHASAVDTLPVNWKNSSLGQHDSSSLSVRWNESVVSHKKLRVSWKEETLRPLPTMASSHLGVEWNDSVFAERATALRITWNETATALRKQISALGVSWNDGDEYDDVDCLDKFRLLDRHVDVKELSPRPGALPPRAATSAAAREPPNSKATTNFGRCLSGFFADKKTRSVETARWFAAVEFEWGSKFGLTIGVADGRAVVQGVNGNGHRAGLAAGDILVAIGNYNLLQHRFRSKEEIAYVARAAKDPNSRTLLFVFERATTANGPEDTTLRLSTITEVH